MGSHVMTDVVRMMMVAVAPEIVELYKTTITFLSRVVTGNETWLHKMRASWNKNIN